MQWESRLISPRRREFFKAIDTINLSTVSGGEPTYWPTDSKKIPNLLNFGLTRDIPKNSCSTESYFDLSSDHSPVIIILNSKITTRGKPCTLYNAKIDWSYFHELLTTSLNNSTPLKTVESFNHAIQ